MNQKALSAEPQDLDRGARVQVELAAELPGLNGYIFTSKVLDISRGGICLIFDRGADLRIIWPRDTIPGRTVDVLFELPTPEVSTCRIEARCRVVWGEPLSTGSYRMGLEIVDLDQAAAETLDRYLQDHRTDS